MPNSSSVFAFGVAVNAKKERFAGPAAAGERPREQVLAVAALRLVGSVLALGRVELSSSERADSARRRSAAASPVCEECASSTITAYRRAGSASILSSTNGNFCSVVTMIRACSPASASASWLESLSIRTTTPCTCSNW